MSDGEAREEVVTALAAASRRLADDKVSEQCRIVEGENIWETHFPPRSASYVV